MDDDEHSRLFSPLLADGWMNSRWGPDDQRGAGGKSKVSGLPPHGDRTR
jgi:hypothetical protein